MLSPEGRKESGQARRADVHYTRFLGSLVSLCLFVSLGHTVSSQFGSL